MCGEVASLGQFVISCVSCDNKSKTFDNNRLLFHPRWESRNVCKVIIAKKEFRLAFFAFFLSFFISKAELRPNR